MWVSFALGPFLAVLAASDGGALLSAESVLRLSREEAAQSLPVRLEGVVTYADPLTRDFFVQDSSGAISMWYPDAGSLFQQGDVLRIEGVTAAGDYAPKLEPLAVTRLRQGAPVPVAPPSQADLLSGAIDCRSIQAESVVRDAMIRDDQLELRLQSILGPTRVLFPKGSLPAIPAGWVGAEIRLRATVGIDVNELRQRVGLRLYVQRPDELVLTRAAAHLDAIPRVSLEQLLQYQPALGSAARVRVAGVITYSGAERVTLDDGSQAVRIAFAPSQQPQRPFDVGTFLDVVGFVESDGRRPKLVDVLILTKRLGEPPVPLLVDAGDWQSARGDDRVVRVRGRITQVVASPLPMVSVETKSGPVVAVAFTSAKVELGPEVVRGALVEVTGIKSLTADQVAAVVLLRETNDVRVVAPPPILTVPRLLVAVGFLALLAGGLAWRAALMRRRRSELETMVSARTQEVRQANQLLEQRAALLERQTRELQEQHSMRARLIATMVHDVRTPLTVMSLLGSQLKQELPAQERQRLAEDITESVLGIDATLRSAVQRYRDERIELKREPLDLKTAAQSAAKWVNKTVEAKQQQLVLKLPPEAAPAIGDAEVLAHVVMNLVSNASKFSRTGTVITIEVNSTPPSVKVTDEGQGLGPEDVQRLFAPTGPRPSVRPTAGESTSGDGLLLSSRWVEGMGGTLRCQSRPGQGSTFTLELPVKSV